MQRPKVINELNRIRLKNNGILQPDDVVSTAADEDNVLHEYFCWDNDEAAHKYRLEQARNLIRVCVMDVPATQTTVRCFVSLAPDRSEKGGGYRAITDVMSSADLMKQWCKQAENEFRSLEQKYRQISELTEVFNNARNVFKALKEAFSESSGEGETVNQENGRIDDILRPDLKELEKINTQLRKLIDDLEYRNKDLESMVAHLEGYIGQQFKSRGEKKREKGLVER